MEIRCSAFLVLLFGFLAACTNSQDLGKGEIEVFSDLRQAFEDRKKPKTFVDARKLVTREKIDASGLAVLLIELETGQSGTSVLYPGENTGEVWLGVDGATVTFEKGFLIGTRGLQDDLMATIADFPKLSAVNGIETYDKHQTWLKGDNQRKHLNFRCTLTVTRGAQRISLLNKSFVVKQAVEICKSTELEITNEYFYENSGKMRQSKQYHSETLGYIRFERLDG